MKPTEHNANAASTSKTGLLRAASRTCIFGTLLTLAALAFTAAPALAAVPPPEAPVTSEPAASITGTSAVFEGVLNPHAKATVGGFFAYSYPGGMTCLEGPTVALEGIEGEQEVQAQPVHAPVALEPDRTYKFCLVATNEAGAGVTAGNEVEVVTPAVVPAVEAYGTTAVTPFAAYLEAIVNANNEEVTKCEFEYGTSPTLATETKTVPCEQATLEGVYGGQYATVNLSGLTSGKAYYYRVVATNATGTSNGTAIETFTTLTAESPIVEPGSESVSKVGAKDAKLQASVNPNYQATTYVFEYASEAALLGTPAAKKVAGAFALPAGFGAQTAGPVDLGGALQESTTYYYRIVATNASGETLGEAAAFTTSPPATAALPDGRAYELVSDFPAGQEEEAYVPQMGDVAQEEEHGLQTQLPVAVASDGEAVVYPGDAALTGGTGLDGKGEGNEYLATRAAGGGWSQADIQPPGLNGARYHAFSNDLSVAMLAAPQDELGGGTEEYNDLYIHPTAGGAEGEYRPVYSGRPPNRTPHELGAVAMNLETTSIFHGYAGGNSGTSAVPAFSHLLFEVNDALPTLNVAAVDGAGEDSVSHLPFADEDNLYDSTGGELYLVNVLPDGHTEPNASYGQFQDISPVDSHGVSHVISADGSRIFWTALDAEQKPRALYVRENDTLPDASTVLVASGEAYYWTASSDGSLVFYTKEGNLYSFDLETSHTTDLSVAVNPSEQAEVQGVVGASEDGSYVYFVATGVLSGENGEHHSPASGGDNLYLWHAGATTFVATLSSEDGEAVVPFTRECQRGSVDGYGCVGDWQAPTGNRSAEVTPNGQSVVFMSNQRLTGYDNDDNYYNKREGKEETAHLDEVFLFQAVSGALRCVSCNPSGEPPVPTELNTDYIDIPLGGFIPIGYEVGERPRVISENGDEVFFDSGEPLVPTDTNGWLDVYEWERAGTPGGSCPEDAPNGGCVYLLSGGTSPENSYLLGADASGANAFFFSRAQLVPADRGDDEVVYDARVDGVEPPAPAACEGTSCQGVPPTPPIFATPASVTFSGTGNFPASPPAKPAVKSKTKTVKCKKPKKLSHGKCVKPKRKTKKSKAKKSTHTNRRAKS